MSIINPKNTKIVQTLDVGDGFVIMEDYYEYPEKIPNIYKVDYSLNPVWEAELPSAKDVYANKMIIDEGVIKTSSWEGIYCELDIKTGRILKKNWTK